MPEKSRRINRREFIKWSAGAAGLLAGLSSPLLLNRAKAAPVPAGAASPAEYDEHNVTEEKVRAWCMVIDLKKCDGCMSIDTPPQCTQVCINAHFAPKGEEWIQVYKKELEGGGHYFMPAPCFQCENAPCVNVCPVAATYHDKSGVVLIDHNRCIGCRMCMAACPYQRRFFNWGTPKLPPEAALVEYSPLYPVPAVKGTVIKCMFCGHMLHDGKLPECVQGCPMKALYIGDLNGDVATNGAEVVQLSKFLDENNAFRYKDELGTQPRVWYLPGYGQEQGRTPKDPREMKPPVWAWGGDGFNRRVGIWPWGEDF